MTEMCIAAANFIIEEVNKFNTTQAFENQVFMSSKRLQKLLFFSDVLYMLEHNGQSMYKDDYYAWESGPVIPSVYRAFMQYQDGAMYPQTDEPHTPINDEMKHTIRRVLYDTRTLDTSELVRQSHQDGSPWQQVYIESASEHNCAIDKDAIYKFYCENGAPYGCLTQQSN